MNSQWLTQQEKNLRSEKHKPYPKIVCQVFFFLCIVRLNAGAKNSLTSNLVYLSGLFAQHIQGMVNMLNRGCFLRIRVTEGKFSNNCGFELIYGKLLEALHKSRDCSSQLEFKNAPGKKIMRQSIIYKQLPQTSKLTLTQDTFV